MRFKPCSLATDLERVYTITLLSKMLEINVEIGTPGIKNTLKRYDAASAVAEFIWNGFDAGAKIVSIEYESNEIGHISELRIVDNGSGIPLPELNDKFKPFLHTNKVIDPSATHHGPSTTHGKNGIGRLTFFHFAEFAEWDTIYLSSNSEFKRYKIQIDASKLNKVFSELEIDALGPTGTITRFTNVSTLNAQSFDKEITQHLVKEFSWFLELQAPFPREIRIHGETLDYSSFIGDKKETTVEIDNTEFKVKYVRWNDNLRKEYSRYYFIGSDNRERAKRTTTFNNKGDDFYHSVYIISDYFNVLEEGTLLSELENNTDQGTLPLSELDRDKIFADLVEKLEKYLRTKRSPFLRKRAEKYIQDLESEGAFPIFNDEPWEQHRKRELTGVVIELYEADPRIFRGLNNKQKHTLIGLFSLIMDSSEREQLLKIIEQVINLDSKDRANLAKILEVTQLSNLTATVKLIEDRFRAVSELRKMVFSPCVNANERDHLQAHIQMHYWLFGEQYHLVTAAEPDFVQALQRYLYVLRGQENIVSIDHPDKNKEMDVFLVRWLSNVNQINNVVLELKHPDITLTSKELGQVKRYMNVILDQPEFNAKNMTWDFYLIGTSYNDEILGEIESAQSHGEKHLAFKRANYKIYILNWSEVITNFELRHGFLLDKLKFERDKLATKENSADGILANSFRSSAVPQNSTSPILAEG